MEFAKRMDMFSEGIFSLLGERKKAQMNMGKRVVDLSIGAPNIPPADHVIETLHREVLNKENYVYALNDLDELQNAVAEWYMRRYGVDIDPRTEVVSLLGSQDGLAHIALSIIDEGDIVLVQDPCYPVFADGPRIAGADVHFMAQRPENGYVVDLDEIPKDVARAAKLMIISYPNNPTAALAPDAFYEKLIRFAKEYDIIILHDNAYSELVFDGATCGSFLRFPGAREVGVEFNSLSKSYGLAGARVGFCIGSSLVVSKLKVLKSNMDYGMFIPVQKAAVAAITGDQSCVEAARKAYERRRDILCDGLTAIGWPVERSKATMFVWTKIPSNYTNSMKFVMDLLERAGVLVTPGSAFGPSGEGYVRLALVQDEEAVRYAVESIKNSGILV